MQYLIWSNEHNAWWHPDSRGYTVSIESAGRYSLEAAISVCNGANYGWDDDQKIPKELPIAEEAALLLDGQKDYRTPQKPVSTGMKVSATGLLNRCADLLPKRATVENQADMHRFLLREMARHIEGIHRGEVHVMEFLRHYCILPSSKTEPTTKEKSHVE